MRRLLLLFLFFCGVLLSASAQQKTITGTVTGAEDNKPVIGCTVQLKGTTTGITTDINGRYTLAVPQNATSLVFSFIGLKKQEVEIGNRSVIDIVLEPDLLGLDEVIVTAVGIQRSSKSVGYSVSNVNAGQTQIKSEPDMLKTLQGKIPGVDIRVGQGAPGSATKISIRGSSSFFGSNQPLIIVDGVPYSNDQVATSDQTAGNGGAYSNGLSTLDPNNIETLTVLKGSAAAALYGSRASNGVLLVTTKSGKGGENRKGFEVSYTTSIAKETISNLPDYQNSYGNGTNFTYSNANGSWGPRFDSRDSIPVWPDYLAVFPQLFPSSGNTVFKAQPNNVKDLFKTGTIYENSLSVSGGDSKNSFSATASALNQDGYIPESTFDRYSISVGGRSKLTNGLNVGGNLTFSSTDQVGGFFGENQFSGAASSFARSLFLGRTWDMTLPYENPTNGWPVSPLGNQFDNPLWSYRHNTIITTNDRTVAGINIDYNINSWFNIAYSLGMNNYIMFRRQVTDIGSRGAASTGEIVEDTYGKRELESSLLLTFAHELGRDFSLKAILGHNVNQRSDRRQGFDGKVIMVPGVYDVFNTRDIVSLTNAGQLVSGISKRRLYAVFADVSLSYKNWLFLNLVGRNDWSSTLPKDNRSYFYPAISTSFMFTEALGIQSNVLSSGKLRVSYAQVGNDADPYSLQDVFYLNSSFNGKFTLTTPDTRNNPELKPERSAETELGTELQFFNGRIGLDFTWYNKLSSDMIAPVPVPSASGYAYKYLNFGEMRNRGIEIGFTLVPLQLSNGLKWDIYTSFTKNKSEVMSLRQGVERLNLYMGGDLGFNSVIEPGYGYGAFRGTYALRDPDSGKMIIDPLTGFPYLSLDEKIVGDPNPDFVMGVTNTLSYKGITLSALWDWRQGGDLYSVTIYSLLGRGVTKDSEDREHSWIIPGVYGNNQGELLLDGNGNPINNHTGITTNDLYFYAGGNETTFGINSATEFNMYNATVYRLREVSLGYDLPKAWLQKAKIGKINISVTGRNLWYFAPNVPTHTNFDPDINNYGSSNLQGIDLTCAPSSRRFGVNLKVTF
ncbi:MAG: SusC/RagA family TonB-linked outer membrane protein [Bacteroidota bacterium]